MAAPRYQPVAFAALPGWEDDDHVAAFAAFIASASALRNVPGAGPAVEAARAIAAASGRITAAVARAFFEAQFHPMAVVHDGPAGLLTGYYEPVVAGSLTREGVYQVPLYRRPPDLENVVAESERGAKSGGLTHVRRTAQGTEPYATRREIESGALAGQGLELCYISDFVDAFFLQVQGSGIMALPDGTQMRITYDGKNGHPYTSAGRAMIDDGVMPAADLTLQTMASWLRADPERARPYLWKNESYVFFRHLKGNAAEGVLGTPLHTGRSLAIDTAFHALGLPVYVTSPVMTHVAPEGFRRLMVAHDVGSAIKGPERGDIYFGTGTEALALAGITKHVGSFHVLVPKGPS